jgi:two-component system, OmpR family, phosphate regulon sensor histidine kinase PhoR
MFSRTLSLFFWMGVTAVGGYWLQPNSGHFLGAFLVCLYFVIRDLWKGQKITDWLRHNNVQEPPQMGGIWGDLIDRMRRILNEQRKLTLSEQQKLQDFLLAIQASPNGVVLLDPEGRIEWCNQTAAQHLGMDAKRDLMQHVFHLVRDPVFMKYFSNELHDGEVIIDGRSISLQKAVKLSVQLHNYGENRQLLLTRDVTAVAQADAMRRDFVANVSHEIRTPLTVMSGFIETLQSLNLDKNEQEKYLDLMAVQASRMQDLVNDLLILSQLEGSILPSISDPVSLQGLMSSIESEARGLSASQIPEVEAPQILRFDTPEGVQLNGAYKELHSAVSNLVNNAVRYTPSGGLISSVWSMLPDQRIQFLVTDTGPGIASEHLPRLTERFYRVDRSRSRESGGTGLGLAIVKHVMQRHGGELKIESELGRGSKFTLIFPASRVIQPTLVELVDEEATS